MAVIAAKPHQILPLPYSTVRGDFQNKLVALILTNLKLHNKPDNYTEEAREHIY